VALLWREKGEREVKGLEEGKESVKKCRFLTMKDGVYYCSVVDKPISALKGEVSFQTCYTNPLACKYHEEKKRAEAEAQAGKQGSLGEPKPAEVPKPAVEVKPSAPVVPLAAQKPAEEALSPALVKPPEESLAEMRRSIESMEREVESLKQAVRVLVNLVNYSTKEVGNLQTLLEGLAAGDYPLEVKRLADELLKEVTGSVDKVHEIAARMIELRDRINELQYKVNSFLVEIGAEGEG